MEGILKSISGFSALKAIKEEDAATAQFSRDICREIREITSSISDVESKFNFVSDPDLVESAIYQHNALIAKYRYLLKIAKENKINFTSSLKDEMS